MKAIKLMTAIAIALAAVTIECNAQPPAPGRLKEGPRPPAGPGIRTLQQVTAYTGKAGEWVNNDDFVYDGFYLQTSQGKSLVRFPSTMGMQLTKLIKAGTDITVNGVEDVNPDGIKEIRMLSISANGQLIQNTPPAAPPVPEAETMMNGSGKITALQKGKEAEVNGYLIDNKTILRIPPHVAAQLNSLAAAGTTVSFTGRKKATNSNEASAGNYSIVHCETITINGTQYLAR